MPLRILTAAVVAAIVGFGGTLALVVEAARGVGAGAAQTASWVAGLCLAIAVASTVLSLRHRIPIIAAWSTPGAALLAASPAPMGMEAAAGAFVVTALLILVTAAVRPIGTLVARLPVAVAAAMLAGILLRFVTELFVAAAASPLLVLPLVVLFLAVRLASPNGAVLAVLAVGTAVALAAGAAPALDSAAAGVAPVLIMPVFLPEILIGTALPLYLVTMASQNLPGFAVLKAAGYTVPARSILAVTGATSLATAPLGAHTTNLAAITASICTGPEVDPDPARRWRAGPAYGACYLLFALFAGPIVALLAGLPSWLVATVAGLALVAPLGGALGAAMQTVEQRVPAVLTLAVTASGLTLFGIGPAFWGLVVGLLALAFDRLGGGLRTKA